MKINDVPLWYETLKTELLAFDTNVFFDKLVNYDGYKINLLKRGARNFADVYVQKKVIKVQISRYPKYDDPKKMLKESKKEGWTLGYHLIIRSADDISDAIKLIEQSCNFVRNQLMTKNSSK